MMTNSRDLSAELRLAWMARDSAAVMYDRARQNGIRGAARDTYQWLQECEARITAISNKLRNRKRGG